MSLEMNLKYKNQIDVLIQRFDCFTELKGKSIWEYNTDVLKEFFSGHRDDAPKDDLYRWRVPDEEFFSHKKEVSVLPIIFIGKTGYGKSSLLNQIIGKSIFPTDDIQSCTKEIDAAMFRLGVNPDYYFALCDFPGVGESEQADQLYMDWYEGMVKCSPCVIYVLRADQRDYSIDLITFERLFRTQDDLDKVIIALNCADKIEPVSRGATLSKAQLDALDDKVEIISSLFSIESYRIFPCCAHTGYGLVELLSEAVDEIGLCTYEE